LIPDRRRETLSAESFSHEGRVFLKKQRFNVFHLLLSALAGGAAVLLALWVLVGPYGVTFLESLSVIRTGFVGDYDADIAVDQALAGLVDGLGDRWSHYYDPEFYAELNQRHTNTYVGIGVTVRFDDERGLLIETAVDNSPAAQAGLLPGELIIAVEGASLAGEARYTATDLIQGEAGSRVTLTVLDAAGVSREVTVTRAAIPTEPVIWKMLDGNVGYVCLKNFYTNSAEKLCEAVDELVSQGACSLLFDMRENGGGYVDELTDMLDHLLPEGPIFRSTSRRSGERVVISDEQCVDLPMAVLVNENSYSAAEFFAAELQEAAGAKIVGEPTSGKGYSQQAFPLPNGGALNISTARYTTGKGISLVGTGVTLDAEVALTEEAYANFQAGTLPLEDDAQAQKGLELLKQKV